MDPDRLKVLLIDDDEDDYLITRDLLAEAGRGTFDLEWVATYEAGLIAIAQQQHDAYLIDYCLGGYSGLDLLRQAIAQGNKAPLIMLTGQADQGADTAALQAGATDYLVKGKIDGQLLGRAIHYAIAHARTLESLRQSNESLTRWVSELERRNREISLLSEMGELLQTCLNTDEVCAVIGQFARQLFPNQSGALVVFNASRSLLEASTQWGENILNERVFVPEDCWGLRRLRVHEARPGHVSIICRHLQPSAGLRTLCIPLMAHNEALGLLCVTREQDTTDPDQAEADRTEEAHRRLSITLAEHAALSLSNMRLRETLRDQAIRDPLTGLFNRRYMQETLERELRRAIRHHRPLSLLILDLDHFKRVNDRFGHQAGDELLRTLGRFLETHTRREDIVCRYGGEEFLLILPECPLSKLYNRAMELHAAIGQLSLDHIHGNIERISASIGGAAFPEHGPTIERLVQSADAALYQAKADGRDRVVIGV